MSVEKETALSLLKLCERVSSVQNSNKELSAAETLVALADIDFHRKQEETEYQLPFTSQSGASILGGMGGIHPPHFLDRGGYLYWYPLHFLLQKI